MLADPAFADMAQAIGAASLGAPPQVLRHLTKVYWYTVEFGVVLEGGEAKAFGAGILSSYGEMEHMASGAATVEPLDPRAPLPKINYSGGFQEHYFSLDSFRGGADLLRGYA